MTRFAFTKGAGRSDTLVVLRDDGRRETIECPKQGIVPHDMVHYAVEHALAAHGFLGRVAAGEAASFAMGATAEGDGVERLVEVIQGDAWSGGATPAAEMIALYHITCDARGCPPLPVDPAGIEVIRAEMRRLTEAWAAVPVAGTLTLAL